MNDKLTILELQAGAPEVYQLLWQEGYISESVALWQKYAAIYDVERKAEIVIKPSPPPTPASMVYPITRTDVTECFPELAGAIEASGRQAAADEEERIRSRVILARTLEFKQRIALCQMAHQDTRQHPENRERAVAPPSPPPKPLTLVEQAEEDWKKDPDLRREFMNDKTVYLAYVMAKSEGRAKVYGG